jgi:hypothetical protein
VDVAVEVLGSAEAFERTFRVHPDFARHHSRQLSSQFFTDLGEIWCNNEQTTSRITSPLIDRIKHVSEARKKETWRHKQLPNRSPAGIDANNDHEHFAAVIDDLVVMFTDAVSSLYPVPALLENMLITKKPYSAPDYATLSTSNRRSDSEDDCRPEIQRRESPPKEKSVKSLLTKSQRNRIVTQAAIDGIGDESWDSLNDQFTAVKQVAVDFVDRSFESDITLVTRSQVLNVAYHFIQVITDQFSLIHMDTAVGSEVGND